jgi:hypothetical protein
VSSADDQDYRGLARALVGLLEVARRTLTEEEVPSELVGRVTGHLGCALPDVVAVHERFPIWDHANVDRGVEAYLARHGSAGTWFGMVTGMMRPHQDLLSRLAMPAPGPMGKVGMASYGTVATGPDIDTEVVTLGLIATTAPGEGRRKVSGHGPAGVGRSSAVVALAGALPLVHRLVHGQVPVPEGPGAEAPRVPARAVRGRDGQHGAPGPGQAVAAHPAVPGPAQQAPPPRPHHQQVTGGTGQLDQGMARLAAHHEALDLQAVGDASPGGFEGLPQPLEGGLRPDPPEVRRRAAPLGKITSGRQPGMNDHQQRVVAPRDPARVPQRRDAARRPARTNDDTTLPGHGGAPLPRRLVSPPMKPPAVTRRAAG